MAKKTKTPKRPDFDIINDNAYYWMRGLMFYFQNPDNIPLATYEKMLLTDDTVSNGLGFLILAAMAQMGEFTHENKKIQKFVRDNFEKMRGNLCMKIKEILTSLWAGFSVTEICWKYEDGKYWVYDLQTLNPATVIFDLEQDDGINKNCVKAVWQYKDFTREKKFDNPSKFIVHTCNKRFGNPYGNSMLKSAYKNWYIKDEMFKLWAKAMSRHASPWTFVTTNDLHVNVDIDGVEMTNREYLSMMLNQMYEGNIFISDDQTTMEIKQQQTAISDDFLKIIDYCNKMIYRSLLMPPLVGDNGKAGSYALGKKHFDSFIMAAKDIMAEIIECLLEQLVRWMIVFNFRNYDNLGEWSVNEIGKDDLEMLSAVYEKLTDTGYISPADIEDRTKVRREFGFSEKSKIPEAVTEQIAAKIASEAPAAPVNTTISPKDNHGDGPSVLKKDKVAKKSQQENKNNLSAIHDKLDTIMNSVT